MDGRERLRRYLEQRRELGESELMLDGLSVEDALAIVAGGKKRDVERVVGQSTEAPRVQETPLAMGDWREALRAAGASPQAAPATPTKEPTKEPPLAASPRAETGPTDPAVAAPPVVESAGVIAPPGIVVGALGRELVGGLEAELDSLAAIVERVAGCTRCALYATAKNPVPGEGSPHAGLMCVGEAPGATEDETGRPFVGQAGQLLTKILGAVNLSREDVFICNVLKHRPPGNRNPLPEEVKACSPYLIRQIELIQPKVILALGSFAAQTLLDTKLSIGKLRGQIHRYYGVPLIVTYHPAALLRNPAWKRPTWEDVQLARRILDSAVTGA